MARSHRYFVYILTNGSGKVMYVGMTNNIVRRMYEHKTCSVPGFACRYKVNKLVYFEEYREVVYAIDREKQIKGYRRSKKDALVVAQNPGWEDLSRDL